MDFAEIRTMARRVVHETFAVPCLYLAPGAITRVPLTARLHSKMVVGGDLAGGGYATVIEGVTRAVFNREALKAAGVSLRKRGQVTFLDYQQSFELDVRDTFEGTVTEKWSVAPIAYAAPP